MSVMRYLKLSLVIGLGVWPALVGAEAFAQDRAACFDAASQGQTLRDEHKLVEARDQFRVCAQQYCPMSMRTDCDACLDAMEKSVPTVVVRATDATGSSVFDVAVSIDGRLLVAKLDGSAVSVNPGTHTFRFERVNGTSVEQVVQINEGDRNQKIAVVLKAAPPPVPPPAPGLRAPQIIGLAGGVVGLAGIVVGSVFGLRTYSDANKQKSDCPPTTCTEAGNVQGNKDHSAAVTDGTISMAAFIAGGALVATGVVLFLAKGHTPATPTSTGLVLWPAVGPGGGSSARGHSERDLFDDPLGHRVTVTQCLDARQRDLSAPALAASSKTRGCGNDT
jgi:hypothetical protein